MGPFLGPYPSHREATAGLLSFLPGLHQLSVPGELCMVGQLPCDWTTEQVGGHPAPHQASFHGKELFPPSRPLSLTLFLSLFL